MTNQTIEEYFEYLTDFIGCAPDNIAARQSLDAIRDYLLTQQSNTLPLDEIPEGWKLSQLTFFGDNENDFCVCDIINRGKAKMAGSGVMPTPTEALRAAIAAVKENDQ